MNILDQARAILRKSDIYWIELDLKFDVDVWKTQMLEAEPYYQEYRESDSTGWSSCCLHGLGVDKPYVAEHYGHNEYQAPYQYTDLAYKVPAITDFWKNQFPTERYTRLRFMKVSPGGRIGWHNDGTIPSNIDPLDVVLPINVAVKNPINCTMQIEDQIVPWEEGKIFMLNISKNHAVFNHSAKSRIHMIANIILGNRKEEFAEMLVSCYTKQYGKI
jgi:hypothetical protein